MDTLIFLIGVPVACFVTCVGIFVYSLCNAAAAEPDWSDLPTEELTEPMFTLDEGGTIRERDW